MKALRAAFILIAVALSGPGSLHALVVNYGTGTENKTDPGFALPWDNVGKMGGTTAVYLGSFGGQYWIATATHAGVNNVTLGSTTYEVVAGSAVQIEGSDLRLFRISADPGLANLALASTTPNTSSLVTMIGTGRVENAYTKWNINTATEPDTWTVTSGASFDEHGYTTVAGGDKRWGFGYVHFTGQNYNVGTGSTQAFVMGFVDGVATVTPSAASLGLSTVSLSMGQSGDSGGAVFAYNHVSSQWELVGIMGAIGTFSGSSNPNGQPGNTAVFGNMTFGIDLAHYNTAINTTIAAAIPEPSTVALICGLVALTGVVALRRRKRR